MAFKFKIKNAPSLLLHLTILFHVIGTCNAGTEGHWVELRRSIGISAMHMQVMTDNKVVIFDRTDFGPSNISLSNGRCRFNPRDLALKLDCTAHSVLYDIPTNTLRPLTLQTDAWCSSGAVAPDGTLIQTGGFNDGYHKLRTFTPCPQHNQCDWLELPHNLTNSRWYASNHILPDGRIIVVGGRSSFTYEFVPKNDASFYYLRFLRLTRDPNPGEENNLYPFLHLLPDGNLFIFANRNSILFDYTRNRVIREFPIMPGDEKRNYPSTGSSVLLPLNLTGLQNGTGLPDAEVMICGGAFPDAFSFANKLKVFLEASRTCGRLRVTDPEPEWVMEFMPTPRVMPDMILLPTGNVLILNGAMNGTAGWENAANPAFYPVLYRPGLIDPFSRFQLLPPANTPRMYHSAAVLLPDGRVLVGGSNPHRVYDFRAYPYPTELSLDAYYPDYLRPELGPLRPTIIAVEAANNTASYGGLFSVTFSLTEYRSEKGVVVTLVAPSFTTHSFAMNQRVLVLDVVKVENGEPFDYKVTARGPPSLSVAPPGYYMLFIVHGGVPSSAVWVQVR
ncbi:aldehyde oxidase GLOX [Abrus precatorius]|uniref:Aldehyde oxidase GLOX n=1 Tax=Abrus precatorius TaxID=3816 RepID=A0A8B8M492_ABRPR|nr:aldehyde oxidase GLOX [Abrus precatorius]